MQTDNDIGNSEAMNPSFNIIIKRLPNEDTDKPLFVATKKEPRDSDKPSYVAAKKEPREEPSRTRSDQEKSGDLLNDITETSSDEESENSNDTKDRVTKSLKKEELTEIKMLDDQDELLNEDDDLGFSNSSNEQFSFNLDNNDQLGNDFLDEGAENPLADCDADAEEGTEEPNDEPTDGDNVGEDESNALLKETDDNNDCDSNAQSADENANDQNTSADENPNDEQGNAEDDCANNEDEPDSICKTSEDAEKEAEPEMHDNKRPASRESIASTTSNSSERLTIRSASDVNNLVPSVPEAIIKKEKVSQDVEEHAKEKPHLSVVNPSQLGVSNSGGENLLQNVSFAQPNEQMNVINYIGGSAVSVQCDVCETQFPDNMMLAEHKASAGHYKCVLNPDCAALVFASMTEMSAHQQSVHGVMPQSPVQQLAHQVQSLPIRYQMEQPMNSNYQPMQQYPPQIGQSNRPLVPQVYPGQQGSINRAYPMTNQPRLQIGSVRGNVPMVQPPNLKRASPAQARITPTKRARADYMRNGDTDCKVVSVQKPDNTDDVVAQLSKSITITARQDTQKKNDTAAVTNMLANRGITVSSVPAKQNRNSSAVAMLNLNSAVSLIPTNNANRQNQARTNGRQVGPTNASRLQTVDLTGPDPPRNRQLNRGTNRFQCQICDRTFFNQDQLNQHMITHRNGTRKQLPYKCNFCTAQYPNQQQLQQHKQTFHREAVTSTNEMVIPVVDLKQPNCLQKLGAIGVHHIIPLNALGTQASNGTFGIPILPLSSDRNQQINMSNCGITNILPIGPLKTLGR